MDNPLQTLAPPTNRAFVFEHPKFGVIRGLTLGGKPYFVGNDAATALEYADPFAALKQHVPKKFKLVLTAKQFKEMASNQDTGETYGIFSNSAMGGVQRLTLINEAGLYKLIFRSNLPAAEEFSDWVCEEVLPAIRETGTYSLVSSTAPVVVKREKNQNRVNGQLTDACVYVAHKKGNFNIVKIGQSHDPKKRVSKIKDMDCDDIYQTFRMPRKDARTSESICLEYHAPFKLEGEFFCANFYDVCRFIKALVKGVAKFKPVSETTVRKAITDLKAFINDPSIKKLAAPPTK